MNLYIMVSGLLAALTMGCSKQPGQQYVDAGGSFSAPLVEVAVDSVEGQYNSAEAAGDPNGANEPGFNGEGSGAPDSEQFADTEDKSKGKGKGKEKQQEPGKGKPSLTAEEADLCSLKTKGNKDRIKVAGSKGTEQFTVEDTMAIKIAGNQNSVTISTQAAEGKSIKGICIFITGNQNKITVNVKSKVDYIYFKARGNLVTGMIQIEKGAVLAKSFFDLSGNQATLTVAGEGDYNCQDESRLHGNDPRIICNK